MQSEWGETVPNGGLSTLYVFVLDGFTLCDSAGLWLAARWNSGLHVLPLHAWVLSGYSGYFSQSKNLVVGLIGSSKLPCSKLCICMFACLHLMVVGGRHQPPHSTHPSHLCMDKWLLMMEGRYMWLIHRYLIQWHQNNWGYTYRDPHKHRVTNGRVCLQQAPYTKAHMEILFWNINVKKTPKINKWYTTSNRFELITVQVLNF